MPEATIFILLQKLLQNTLYNFSKLLI